MNPSLHDWFLQSIQHLVDYMCLSFKKKMTVELQLKRKNILDKNESIIHNADKKDSIASNQSPLWVSSNLPCWAKEKAESGIR